MKTTSRSSLKTRSSVADDQYMLDQGFREMTPDESRRSAHFFACAAANNGKSAGADYLTDRAPRRFSCMSDKRIYIERRDDGRYSVRRAGAEKASLTADTQAKAIERARALNPGVSPHVERVRNTTAGGRDKWRRA